MRIKGSGPNNEPGEWKVKSPEGIDVRLLSSRDKSRELVAANAYNYGPKGRCDLTSAAAGGGELARSLLTTLFMTIIRLEMQIRPFAQPFISLNCNQTVIW
jgi:hypothetical protein